MKELKDYYANTTAQAGKCGIRWNPVKELKVDESKPSESHASPKWNPVKELKVFQVRNVVRARILVESGEGIESSKVFRSCQFSLNCMWNPVKELKVQWRVFCVMHANPVESGEGIESLLTRRTDSSLSLVESGEGIERYRQALLYSEGSLGKWNPVKELKVRELLQIPLPQRPTVESGEGIESRLRSYRLV